MNQLFDNLRSLGRGRLIAMSAVFLGVILATLIGMSTLLSTSYQTLYSGLSPSEASGIVTALEQAGFKTQVSQDSAVVRVPEVDLARARMVIADAGLAKAGAPGWELFDNSTGLGMNSFMQRTNRQRALQGELERSIQTLDSVESARVHLVLPEREAFSRETPSPSASIIIRSKLGTRITNREALSVRNLVAAAVPDLDPGSVAVISVTGETILAEDDGSGVDAGIGSRQAEIEARMARNIESILSARVGAGNVRVQVSAVLNNERRVTVEESYDPDQQVARSVETNTEQSEGREAGGDQVGVQGNIPAGLGGNEADSGSSDSSERNRERTEFVIGGRRSEIVAEPGSVERVTVAVLVNGIYVPNGTEESTYEERTPEEIERLSALVKSAVGFNAERGDEVSIDSLRFMDYSMSIGETDQMTISNKIAENFPFILRLIFALAVVALVILFAVRPALNRIYLESRAELASDLDRKADLLEGEDETTGLATISANEVAEKGFTRPADRKNMVTINAEEDDEDQFVTGHPRSEFMKINSVRGLITRRHIDSARNSVDEELDTALEVLRGWLGQKGYDR